MCVFGAAGTSWSALLCMYVCTSLPDSVVLKLLLASPYIARVTPGVEGGEEEGKGRRRGERRRGGNGKTRGGGKGGQGK